MHIWLNWCVTKMVFKNEIHFQIRMYIENWSNIIYMVWSKWQFARIYSRSCWWFSLCRKWQFSQVNYKKVETAFLINKEDKLNFKYLRLNVTWNNNNITLNQFEYIQNLQEVNIPASRKNILTSTLGKEEKDISPVKIGQLFWISNQIGY